MGKWDNGIRVGISEKMKVGANDSNEMLTNFLTSAMRHPVRVRVC